MDAADPAGVEHRQVRRHLRHPVGEHHLQLHHVVLQLGQGPLQQHFAVVHDAHVVTDILQLPQVVGAHQDRGAPLGHVRQHQGPHLAPHHRVQAVHRLVQDQVVRHAAQGQPEGGLLLHALAEAADGPLFVQLKDLLQLFIPLHGKIGIKSPVKAHHIPDGGLEKIVPVIGDGGDPGFQGGVFPDVFAADADGARILAEDARQVADQSGFSGAVGAHQAIDTACRHRQCGAVQGGESVESLYQAVHFDHDAVTSFTRASSSCWLTPRYRSSERSSRTWVISSARRAESAAAFAAAKLPFPGTE